MVEELEEKHLEIPNTKNLTHAVGRLGMCRRPSTVF